MRRLALAILRIYPRAWRGRYRDEVADLLVRRPVRASDLVDLVRGAVDARLQPQAVASLQLAAAAPAAASMATSGASPGPAHGVVAGIGRGQVSRRSFLRRGLGFGVGLLSLEFVGGTIAFLWPPPSDGIGVEHRVGTARDIIAIAPDWATGTPWEFRPARAFLVNVPAATAMARGEPLAVPDPGGEILALWRKCPHLGCMIPSACETRSRFQCLCHQSTYNILGEKLRLGPAPRGLDRFPVRIDADGTVIVDTRELIKGAPAGTVTFRDPFPQDEGCA